MTDATIGIVIDPSRAEGGGKRVVRTLDDIKRKEEQTQRTMRGFNRGVADTSKGFDTMSNALRRNAQAIAVLQGPLGAVSGRLSALGSLIGAINPAVAAAAIGFAALSAAMVKSVGVAEAFERSGRKTEAILRATAQASGQTAASIRTMSEEIAATTLASVQGVEQAAQKLLTFRSVGEQVFRRTLDLSQDLAEVGFGSIDSAATQLGKALENPAQGLTMLTRVGVSFSEQTKEQIRLLYEQGRVLEAQTVMLDAVERQVGGAGSAAAGGLSGAYDTLAQNVEKFLVNIGNNGPIQATIFLMEGLASAVAALNSQLFPEFDQQLINAREEFERLNEAMSDPAFDRGSLGGQILQTRLESARQLVEVLEEQKRAQEEVAAAARERGRVAQQEIANEARLAKAIEDKRKADEKAAKEQERLAALRTDTIVGLQSELRYRIDLTAATEQGAEAVNAVEDARKAELIVQRLKLDGTEIEIGLIAELVQGIETQKRATEAITEAQKKAADEAKKAADKQRRAAEKAAKEYQKVWDNAVEDVQRSLTDSIEDALAGNLTSLSDWSREFMSIIRRLAANLISQALVIPVVTAGAGAIGMPGAGGASGGGGGFSPVGAVGNHAVGRGLDAIGFDPFGQVSAGFGNLSTNFAGGGISAAMFGQAGGSAAAAGVAAVPGGMTNAATSGLFGAGGSMTAAGALGIAGIVAALGLAAYTMGIIGPNPSVGPTGVARLPNVIGRSEMELTSDNDGNPDAAEQVAKSIRDISTSAADTLGAFGRNAFGLDVGSFPQPEDGSGQPAGFNLKRIIDNVMESEDFAKGLTADEAITEGVRETLQGAFDGFDVAGVSTALENSAAKTIEELLSDLDLANAIGTFAEGGRDALMELTRPLTAVEQAFRDMSDAAEEGVERARELGLSVNDATAYFAELRDQLEEQTQESFDRRLRAATGNGALNIIDDMLARRGQDANSAAAAGLDVNATAGAVFDAELRQALGGASLADLGRVFANVTDEQTRSILTTIINERALASVREVEVAGMQTLFAEHERFANAANDNARTLRNAANSFLTNPNLSPLSPFGQLEEARRQFEASLGVANDNDPTDDESQRAIQQLPSLSQTLLEASRAYFGSTEGYLEDFNRVQSTLNATALRQESVEEQQLSALRDIENAIRDAGGAIGSLTPAQQAAVGGFNFGRRTEDNMSIFNALTAAGLPTPDAFGAGELSALRNSNPAVHAIVSALGFNSGGSFTVAGPAGNDNLLMPLRLTAGEAVNVHRGDTMQAVVAKLGAIEGRLGEVVQLEQAAVFELNQTRAENIRLRQTNERLARELSERDAQQPRRAYG